MANGTNASLIQLIDTFQQISLNHNMINGFFVGEPDEVTAKGRTYPLLWIDPGVITPYEAYKEYMFRLYVMDTERNDNSVQSDNPLRYEIISDADQTIGDIMIALRDVYDLRVKFGKPITTFSQMFNNNSAGAFIDLIISVPSTYGMGDFPVKQQVQNNELIDFDGTYFGDQNDNRLESLNLQ